MLLTTSRRVPEPAADLFTSLHRFNRFMDEAMGTSVGNGLTTAWVPACDVSEDKENLRIVLDLPGVCPEEVKISLENHILTIRGEKRQVTEESNDRWHRYERAYGSFMRSFTLPEDADGTKISAEYKDGVLNVRLPKSEKAKPKSIEVKVS